MWRYIFWKMITSFIALIIITLLFFFLYVGIKGNPFEDQRASLKPEEYQDLLNQHGINDPIFVRFGHWVKGVFHGNWGEVYNLAGHKTVPQLLFKPLKTSMLVMGPSYVFGMLFGLILGFVAGYNRGKAADIIINGFVTVFIAIPSFVLAAFALIIGPALGLPVIFQDSEPGLMIRSLIMPITVTALLSLASWTYLTRIEVSKILASDYILSARTKGFSEWTIFKRYVFRNAMYPYAGSLAVSFMVLFGSSIVIEKFFNVDGTSTLLLNASKQSEINLMMFNLVFFLFIGLFAQAIADIAQFTINPIIRSAFSTKSSPIAKTKFFVMRMKASKTARLQERTERGGE